MSNRTLTGIATVIGIVSLASTICRAAPASAPATAPAAHTYFPKGTYTLHLQGGYFVDPGAPHERLTPVGGGVGYYILDRFALNAELLYYTIDDKNGRDDQWGVGFNVFIRHHIIERGEFSLFLEGVLGVLQSEHEYPNGGTHFNFTEQLGVGVTYRLNDNTFLMAGSRVMHFSNAQLHGKDENPGANAYGGFVGILFEF